MLNELDSLIERLIYERSPAERKKIALRISEFGEDAIDPLLQAIDRTWETTDIDTDMFIFDALWYTYQNIGLRPFERILMDKNNSFRKYLAKFWIAMIERKELPEQPAGLEWGD